MNRIAVWQSRVEKLAKEMGCELRQRPNMTPMMYVEMGYVEVPTIERQIDYLACLHELGHFHHGHTQGRPPHQQKQFYFSNGVLRSEAQAWDWALDKAQSTPDEIILPQTRMVMASALKSYWNEFKWADGRPYRIFDTGNRHFVQFVFDQPDDYFLKVVNRIYGVLK